MKYLLLIFFLCISIISCKKNIENEANCSFNSTGEGRFVFAPDSVKVDSSIFITLVWENTVPCQTSQGFSDSINGNIRQIFLKTKVDNCDCNNMDYGTTYRDYVFNVNSPGIQIVKTQMKPNVFQTDTIVVY